MPLPSAPTLRPNNPASRLAARRVNTGLLIAGLACDFLGLLAVLSPYVITAPEWQGLVGIASMAGWLLLALGGVLMGLFVRGHIKRPSQP